MKLITGNANRVLAEKISDSLKIPLVEANIKRYQDKEVFVEILENMRGEDVFVIQPTSCPANDTVMELLIIIDALKRGSAARITAIIPYYGYGRQDRKPRPRTPISAKLVANLLTTAGADRALMVDLHAEQIQGFFDIPTDNLCAAPIFIEDIRTRFNAQDVMIVSPDTGGIPRAQKIAEALGSDLVIIDKRRLEPGKSEVMNVIGNVTDKVCILIDDMIDSGGTICNAADALLRHGADEVYAYATHGVFSKGLEGLNNSSIKEFVITDSIEQNDLSDRFRVLSLSDIMAQAINRIATNRSVSELFGWG